MTAAPAPPRTGIPSGTAVRRPGRRLLAAVVTVGVLLVVAAAMAAHARGTTESPVDLVQTDPADQARLGAPPTTVTLAFTAAPDPAQSHLSVRDPGGRIVNAGTLRGDGARGLRQPVAIRAPGGYTVTYHVVFVDGRERVGQFAFTVGTAPPSTLAPVESHQHGVDPLSAVLLVLDGLVVVTAGVLLLRRPAPRAG